MANGGGLVNGVPYERDEDGFFHRDQRALPPPRDLEADTRPSIGLAGTVVAERQLPTDLVIQREIGEQQRAKA